MMLASQNFIALELHRIVCGLSSQDLQVELENHPELLDVVDNCARSPLIWACWLDNVDAVQLLLEHGADIALTCINGSTALHECWDSPEITKSILESGQALLNKGLCNKRNKYGSCPWHLCEKGDIQRLFMQHGCDLSLRNGIGGTALHMAMISHCDASFSEALMVPEVARIDLHARTSEDWTAHELFDYYFPTDEDKASLEGMARQNLLNYVKKLQNGERDVVICEEVESDDDSDDGESYGEEGDADESIGDEIIGNESDDDIFEDATDHPWIVYEVDDKTT